MCYSNRELMEDALWAERQARLRAQREARLGLTVDRIINDCLGEDCPERELVHA